MVPIAHYRSNDATELTKPTLAPSSAPSPPPPIQSPPPPRLPPFLSEKIKYHDHLTSEIKLLEGVHLYAGNREVGYRGTHKAFVPVGLADVARPSRQVVVQL